MLRPLVPLSLSLLLAPEVGRAQWHVQTAATQSSLRGLSVVNERVVWASGSGGVVVHTADGGALWRVDTLPGAARLDIRAIHAFDDRVAHVAATAGRVWRTVDGGRSWSLTYQSTDTTVFLDAIVFWDARNGMVLGDPLDGRWFVLITSDGGQTWREAPRESRPETRTGEAAFAASGSSLVVHGLQSGWVGSGGSVARVFRTSDRGRTWGVSETPLSGSTPTAGIFSLAFWDARVGIAVGGDYEQPKGKLANAALTADGAVTWRPVRSPPGGYRSGVAYVGGQNGRLLVTVGPSGSDVSLDGGETWVPHDTVGFNSVRSAADGSVWAVGPRGRIAKLTLPLGPRSPEPGVTPAAVPRR
jgi:photosystem II stability/assembly factor-like uncharacterized protein